MTVLTLLFRVGFGTAVQVYVDDELIYATDNFDMSEVRSGAIAMDVITPFAGKIVRNVFVRDNTLVIESD